MEWGPAILARAIEQRARAFSLGHPANDRIVDESTGRLIGGATSAAGVMVTRDNAAKLTAVYCGVRILAETMAQLPVAVYRRDAAGGRAKAADHPLAALLRDNPNPEMTAAEFREYMTVCAAYDGDGYAEIEWGANGRPVALWPFPSCSVTPARIDGRLRYLFRSPMSGQTYRFEPEQILRIPGFSMNGWRGVSIWEMFAQVLGVAFAAEQHAATFYSNSATPGGAIEHPARLSEAARKHLRESWENAHQGIDRAHRVAILEEGMKFTPYTLNARDAQLLESRQFSVPEIARILRIPPHLLMDLSRATFSNIEQQGLDFIVHTVTPIAVRQEQRMTLSLLLPSEREAGYYVRHNLAGLARGDMAARGAFYQTLHQLGALSPDEIRALEDMPPLPDQLGEVWARPLNTGYVGPGAPDAEDADRPDGEDMRQAFVEPLAQAIARVRGRFARDCRRQAEKYLPRANGVAYRDAAADVMAGYTAAFAADVGPLVRAFCNVCGGESEAILRAAADADTAAMVAAVDAERILVDDPHDYAKAEAAALAVIR